MNLKPPILIRVSIFPRIQADTRSTDELIVFVSQLLYSTIRPKDPNRLVLGRPVHDLLKDHCRQVIGSFP